MKHAKNIDKYNGSLGQLVEDMGDLDYDTLVQLFELLKDKFHKDSLHDLELQHPKVAQHLENISKGLAKTLEEDVQKLADLCRSYNEKGIK